MVVSFDPRSHRYTASVPQTPFDSSLFANQYLLLPWFLRLVSTAVLIMFPLDNVGLSFLNAIDAHTFVFLRPPAAVALRSRAEISFFWFLSSQWHG